MARGSRDGWQLMRLIIISGVSGGGKSVALHALEDLGYFCVDNLPLNLLPNLADELASNTDSPVTRVAAVVDARDPRHCLDGFPALLETLRGRGYRPEVLFMDAGDEVLLERFSETRRRHPLSQGDRPLLEALQREARLLDPVRQCAARVIDTSQLNVHELRRLIRDVVGAESGVAMSLLLQSFGFKHGAPKDTDMLFDVRCLPNPYWDAELRDLTGRDAQVRAFLGGSEQVQAMVSSLADFLTLWVPCFEEENRAYLSVAVGCTGGRHRSVYVVDELARRLEPVHSKLKVRHRELQRS